MSHFASAIPETIVLIKSSESTSDSRVEMILNSIVGASWQPLSNLFPLIAYLRMCLEEQLFFLRLPRGAVYFRVELVIPAEWS